MWKQMRCLYLSSWNFLSTLIMKMAKFERPLFRHDIHCTWNNGVRGERTVGAWSEPRLESIICIILNLPIDSIVEAQYIQPLASIVRLDFFLWYGLTISVRLKMKKFWTAKTNIEENLAEKKNPTVMGHFFQCVFFSCYVERTKNVYEKTGVSNQLFRTPSSYPVFFFVAAFFRL